MPIHTESKKFITCHEFEPQNTPADSERSTEQATIRPKCTRRPPSYLKNYQTIKNEILYSIALWRRDPLNAEVTFDHSHISCCIWS